MDLLLLIGDVCGRSVFVCARLCEANSGHGVCPHLYEVISLMVRIIRGYATRRAPSL